MTGDSIGNFLDVTEARRAAWGAAAAHDADATGRAQVLAKLSDGITDLEGLVERTELSEVACRSAVRWLADQGLVRIEIEPAGDERLELPKGVKDALEQDG